MSLAEVVEQFPLGETALLHLLAVSSICATRLTRNPETLLWLAQPEVCLASRSRAEMLAEVHALTSDSGVDNNFEALRFWKGREMTRVAVRELAAVAPLEETTGELSLIAEICLRRVFEFWDAELRQRYGSPKADFAILALGKLGGGELNHSSDVDLLFLYSDEGQLTPHISYHRVFQSTGKQDSRNIFEAASGRLAVSSGSAVAPRRLGRTFGPVSREHGKLLRWVRRNVGANCAHQGARNRWQPRVGLRFPAATSAVHLPKESNAGFARGDCEHQAPHRARRGWAGKAGSRRKTWARRHSRHRVRRANAAAYPWRA